MVSGDAGLLSSGKLSQGLDRAGLNVYDVSGGHDERPNAHENIETDHYRESEGNPLPNSLAGLRHGSKSGRLKAKAKKFLGIQQGLPRGPVKAPTLAPSPSKDTDGDRLVQDLPEKKFPPMREIVRNPVETVQTAVHMASGNQFVKKLDMKVIPHGADVQLVSKYNEIDSKDDEEEKLVALQDLEELKKSRQDSFVRWTMDRHVRKVRRVPQQTIPWRNKEQFLVVGEDGKQTMQWEDYCRHCIVYYAEFFGGHYVGGSSEMPPMTKDAIISSIERLILTSAPFQQVLMKIRHVYRWDYPMETALYLLVYFALWALNSLTGAAGIVFLLLILKRRFSPPTVQDLREELEASEDVNETATSLAQLVDKHGEQGWVDPLVEYMGPMLLLQLEDLGNLLEVLVNFYEWRDPSRSAVSLSLLALIWLVAVLTPTYLLVKSTLLIIGIVFFGLFPISSRYPQYRLLVSPMTFLFWKIPTHAEWAIARVQVEGRQKKESMQRADADLGTPHFTTGGGPSRKPTTPTAGAQPTPTDLHESQPDDGQAPVEAASDEQRHHEGTDTGDPNSSIKDIGEYHCSSLGHLGSLCISFEGVRFTTRIRSKELWRMSYSEVMNMRKESSSRLGEALVFVRTNGEEFKATGLKQTDEVFTQIIGYSDVRWQITG